MEIKIGINHVPRDAALDVAMTIDEVVQAYTDARLRDGLLTLTDQSGRKMIIPASSIAYIEFGKEHSHPVGFGTNA